MLGRHDFFFRLADEKFNSSFDYFGYEIQGPNEESMEQAL